MYDERMDMGCQLEKDLTVGIKWVPDVIDGRSLMGCEYSECGLV